MGSARAAGGGVPRRGRWADEEVPCDRLRDEEDSQYAEDDVEDADMEEEDDDGSGDGDDVEPEPEVLRRNWEAECRAVKAIEARGAHSSSAALAAAREARDQAEAAWRRAKGARPLSFRMGRAQQRPDKAQKSLERCRLDLEEFEEQADRRRDELRQRVDEAEERCQIRRGQLDELHVEAGEIAAGSAGGAAARRNGQDVCGMVASELQALAETLVEGTDARDKINLLLSKMASAVPQSYHIGDNDEGSDDDRMDDVRPADRASSDSVSWSEDANGRWRRRRAKSPKYTDAETDGGW